jgi:fibronectin-binding autotransporter adhesin
MKPRSHRHLGHILVSLSFAQAVSAANLYWDGTSASWNTATNWSTVAGATSPDPFAIAGGADDAIFNITTVNAAINVTLDAAQAANSLTFNNTGTTTFRANASGTTARTLTVGTGGITLNAGAGNVAFNNTPATYGTLTLDTGSTTQTWTNNATLLSTGSVTGSGQLNLTGANSTTSRVLGQFALDLSSYTGNVVLTNSRLVNSVATNGFGTTGTLSINDGAQLAVNVASTTVSRAISIAGSGWYDSGVGDTRRGAIRFLQNGSFSNTVTLTGDTRLFADSGRTGTFSGKVTGGFGIEINGGPGSTGTIVFSNSGNDYSGTTTITSGYLRLDHANALGNSTSINNSTGTNTALLLNSVTIGTGKTITISGGGNQNIYGGLSTSSTNTASTWQSAVTIAATDSRIGSEAGTLTVSGNIGQNAAGYRLVIRNNGSATTILSGNNSFSGGLNLVVGGLRMGSANALGNSSGTFTFANGTNAVVFSSDGTTAREVVNPTAVTGTSSITIGDATNNGKLTFSNTFDLGAAVRPLAIASEVEISGAVGGTGGGINKSGAGVLTLSGNNSYTGLTTLSAGQLNLNANTAINGAGGFTVGAAATLDNTSASPVTLTNAGTVTLSNNLTFNGTRGLSFSGNLNQTADLTVTMKGTAGLSLGNYTNTKAGNIILNVYDDNSGNAAALTVGSMALSNSATNRVLTLGNNNLADGQLIVSGVISNGGTATASSISTNYMNVTLEGNNTFAGGLTLSGGTLNMNNAGALGTGTFTIGGGSLNNTSAAAITNSKNNAITVNADFTFTGTKDLNLGNGAVSLGTAAGTARQITVSAGTLTLGGAISNGTTANALNKAGAGTLVLSGTNDYTGATGVKNGNVQLTGSLNTSTSILLGDATNNGKFILGGAGGAVNQTVTGLTVSGTGTSNAVVGGNASVSTLTVNVASGTNTYTGFLGGAGTNENNLAITKTGAGGLTLGLSSSVAPIASTFTGGVDIQAGVLTLANSLGGGGQVATPGGNSAGVFYLGNSSGTSTAELAIANNNITFNNPINVRSGSSGTKTFRISGSSVSASHGGTITLNDNLTVSTAATSSTLTLSGAIEDGVSGAKGITVSGGLVVTSNTNTYTGTTSVTGGTLTATKAAALPGYNSAGKVVVNGGTLQVRVAGSGWTGAELGSLVTNSTKTSGSIAIDTTNGSFTPTSALNIGALSLVKNGTNLLVLDQANSFTGGVTVNAGTLRIADSGALGTGSKTLTSTGGSRVVELSGGVTLGSNISLSMSSNSGDGLGLSSIDGDNEIQGNINYTTGNPALNISSSGTSKLTISGNVTYTVANNTRVMYLGGDSTAANVISGDVSQSGTGAILRVFKQGTGTWELGGTNSYTGDTQVNGGKLVIGASGSLAAASAVSVSNAGSELVVNGTIGGALVVNSSTILSGSGTIASATIDGSLAPGNSIGTLDATGDVTWNYNDEWVFELGSAVSTLALAGSGNSTQDLLNITGGFTKGTGSGFTFDFAGTGDNGFYKLVDWTTSTAFVDTDFQYVNLTGGKTASFIVDGGTSALYLNVVPEPRAALLGGIGVLMLLRRRRLA